MSPFFLFLLASPFVPFVSLLETKENGTDTCSCRCRFGVVKHLRSVLSAGLALIVCLAHHLATAHDVDAAACGGRFETATAERVDGFVSRRTHCRLHARRRPPAVLHFHLALNGHSEVEGKVQAVGREIAIGLHIERRQERGHPKEVARQIAAREFGFPLAAETLLFTVFGHRQVAEFDMADRCIDRGGLEDEVAEFEIHFAVVLREMNRGGDGRCRPGLFAHVDHEVVGEGASLCVGAERQQRAEKEK